MRDTRNEREKTMKRVSVLVIVLAWCFSTQFCWGGVENQVVGQEGDRGVFKYDVSNIDETTQVVVTLTLRAKTYGDKKPHPEGGHGKGVPAGEGEKIYWTVLSDFPTGYTGNVDWKICSVDKASVARKRERGLIIPLPTF